MRKGLESEFYYFYILGNYITVNTKLYHYYSMISKGYGFSSIFFKISITFFCSVDKSNIFQFFIMLSSNPQLRAYMIQKRK